MIDITRPGKYTLAVQTPVMAAAGTLGYGSAYSRLLALDKPGAFITNPVTYNEWSPARGTRVVPLDAGILVHTGHPNPGVRRIIKDYTPEWAKMPIPVIVHLIASTVEDVRRAVALLDECEPVAAIELGLEDDIRQSDAEALIKAAVERTEKPVLVRLPFYDAVYLAYPCADTGAGALVVAAPPRGTARDPRSGRLISGRIYSPSLQPLVLRMVGRLCQQLQDIPIIGAGGIHSLQDARDYLEAGAVAVQVDSVTWIKPKLLERIARDLSGKLVTRLSGAFADEWHPDLGETELLQRQPPPAAPAPRPEGDAPAQKAR
ncbi:MAG: HisA/HisF-related TIM barrel protein [Anaerolineae bacterium]|jgi:dihydroorotate dehydrogenase (NAD+) catalytic subunit|nr:HisA/HisF-related TIM barrel protein [Anaerolineae bacterium]